ncbi:MAG TPA: hypothetical protein VFN54_04860 [Acidimicrobiales bacterium]|nr:hypothetical protein [Acidimicrobiales bacterium]
MARRASRPARPTAESFGRVTTAGMIVIAGEKWRGVADENLKETLTMTYSRVAISYKP